MGRALTMATVAVLLLGAGWAKFDGNRVILEAERPFVFHEYWHGMRVVETDHGNEVWFWRTEGGVTQCGPYLHPPELMPGYMRGEP